ncbi:Crp/Fnr family transcriptional regulator, partial [Bacteroidota bacterium]
VSSISDNIIQKRVMIASKQMRGRIAYILMYFSKEIYMNTKFNLPLSRKEIAQIIDLSTENVIRMLSEFRKDGIIRIDGNDIEILDFPMLERLTRFG